jgi:hypothetical protein
MNLQNNTAGLVIRRKSEQATTSDKKRQQSKKKAKRCDKKRQQATFSLKVLTVDLFGLKFLIKTATNKGMANVRREGGSSLNSRMIIWVAK